MVFNLKYFLAATILFLMEVLIAIYVKDSIIRPYGGDILVVIFLYCLLKSFFNIPVKNAIFGVLVFAFVLEGFQYFNFIKWAGLENNQIAAAVLGSHFDWLDIFLYCVGAVIIVLVEQVRGKLKQGVEATSD